MFTLVCECVTCYWLGLVLVFGSLVWGLLCILGLFVTLFCDVGWLFELCCVKISFGLTGGLGVGYFEVWVGVSCWF